MKLYDSEPNRIAFFANYVPRKCGIATFTKDIRNAVAEAFPERDCPVIAVSDRPGEYQYPSEVRFDLAEQDCDAYRRAADFLNYNNVDVVCIQHEFGIFGGPAGSHLLEFTRNLKMPIVTTCHTILRDPDPTQRRVMEELAAVSDRLVVMSEKGRAFLRDIYSVPDEKIDVIPHGIPDRPFLDPDFYKDQFGVGGRRVLLTFGLLSPNKGIENVIRAMPEIVRQFPDVTYIVLGATHPNLVRNDGEVYRESLVQMAADLGVADNVHFHNRYCELDELTEYISACDVYVTPYLNPAQITSGTLAYSFGCGKAVISTPYWHAEELLADERGILVPFNDSDAIAREVIGLLSNETRRTAMRKKAYRMGRDMIWPAVAKQYMDSFRKARRQRLEQPRLPQPDWTLEMRHKLPKFNLDHLRRMTDPTGLFQHARFALPNFTEGYTSDDNARSLILAVNLEGSRHETPDVRQMATTYAAFLNHAWNPDTHRFRNFMGYDRNWLESAGSEDSHGRTLWALGTVVGKSRRTDLRMWAAHLFEQAMEPVAAFTSQRAWAFTLLGLHEYLKRFGGDRRAEDLRDVLAKRLVDHYNSHSRAHWRWFDTILCYDNAALSQALLLVGKDTGDTEATRIGLESLAWLLNEQQGESGIFRPIGSDGFYPKGAVRAYYDQQPLEAGGTVAACLLAHRLTGETRWMIAACRAFDWFLGANDLGVELYDRETGGCRDGLHVDRVNQNEGAESTLAYLLARLEIESLEPQPPDTAVEPRRSLAAGPRRQAAPPLPRDRGKSR